MHQYDGCELNTKNMQENATPEPSPQKNNKAEATKASIGAETNTAARTQKSTNSTPKGLQNACIEASERVKSKSEKDKGGVPATQKNASKTNNFATRAKAIGHMQTQETMHAK